MVLNLGQELEEFKVDKNDLYNNKLKPFFQDVHTDYALRKSGPFDAIAEFYRQKGLPRFQRDNWFYDLIYNCDVVNYFNKSINFDIFKEGKRSVIDYPINNPTIVNLEGFLSRVLGGTNFKIEQGEGINELVVYLPMSLNTGFEDLWVDDKGVSMVTDKGEQLVFFRKGNELNKLQNIITIFAGADSKVTYKEYTA